MKKNNTEKSAMKLAGSLEMIDINLIIPYTKNIKLHNEKQISMLQGSMKLVGYVQEICVDEDNVILCGHGRWEAILKQGVKFVEVRRIENLTDNQKKQYRIMDNTIHSCTGYDKGLMIESLLELKNEEININQMGISDDIINAINEEDEIEEIQNNEDDINRNQNIYQYNEFCLFPKENSYDIPMLKYEMLADETCIPEFCISHKNEIIDQNKKHLILYKKPVSFTNKNTKNNILAFFLDDIDFQNVWDNAVSSIDYIKSLEFAAVCTPNFSLWTSEPIPFNILSWYKTQWCGRFWQEAGIKIIPTLNYSNKDSYDFCFLGLPKNTPIVIHQIRNVKTTKEIDNFINGFNEAFNRIQFRKCILYGLHSKKSIEIFKQLPTDLQNTIIGIPSWTDRKRDLGLM